MCEFCDAFSYPALLASHLWGLANEKDAKVEVATIEAFFVRFEVFAAYLVICRPQSPRNKDGAPKYEPQEWVWPDQKAREERMAFYRELLDVIYRKSPERVPEWLELGKLEKINLSLASLGLASLSLASPKTCN